MDDFLKVMVLPYGDIQDKESLDPRPFITFLIMTTARLITLAIFVIRK